MKKLFSLFLTIFSIIILSNSVFIYPVDKELPDNLFQYEGTKSNMVYYLKLFENDQEKGYIIKGWYFTPKSAIETTKILIRFNNEEHNYTITTLKKGNYSIIPSFLIICPKNATVIIGNYEIDKKQVTKNVEIGEIMTPQFREMGIYVFTIENKIVLKDTFSTNDDIFIVVSMGLKKTGGYSLELENYEIKENQILINLVLNEPKKGEMVTQAFTIPTYKLNIGKLEKGNYVIKVNVMSVNNVLKFSKEIEVK